MAMPDPALIFLETLSKFKYLFIDLVPVHEK